MNEEMQSMSLNGVWKLVDLHENCKRIGCKWALGFYFMLDSTYRSSVTQS